MSSFSAVLALAAGGQAFYISAARRVASRRDLAAKTRHDAGWRAIDSLFYGESALCRLTFRKNDGIRTIAIVTDGLDPVPGVKRAPLVGRAGVCAIYAGCQG